MKKLFTLAVGMLLVTCASATTPYKNLHTVAEAYPAAAGVVYLAPKNAEQAEFVYDQSEDFESKVFIKETVGENGSQDQYSGAGGYQIDASEALSMYEELLYIEPAEGYEFVCVTNEIQPSGLYYPDICFQSHTGTGTSDYVFSWDYSIEEGNLINVNSASRAEDGNSDTPGQAGVFALENWDEEPNTTLYVIFRPIGAKSPYFDPDHAPFEVGDVNGDGIVNEDDADAIANSRLGKTTIKEKYADTNGDGEINIADAVKIISDLQK